MDYKIIKESVVGYKNKLQNKDSQDYVEYKKNKDWVLCAVADGHSTNFFEYSDVGAKFACQLAIEVFENYLEDDSIEKYLEEQKIQRLICNRWSEKVNNHYKSIKPLVYKTEYIKYSTTLIVVAITKKFRIYLKIGDGGIVTKDKDGFKNIIDNKNQDIVDSIGRVDSYKNMIYKFEKVSENDNIQWIVLYSDGYENCFLKKDDLFKDIDDTIHKYDNSIFSRMMLMKNYKKYLSKLSQDSSYDDISIIFVGLN